MSSPNPYDNVGTLIDNIDVRLSYKIVDLFSEGLYSSPNKAIEELVANSFDAGAKNVAVFLPADFHSQGAEIAVLDDGESMDLAGLKQHWLIGVSNKRAMASKANRRNQIGKFGIGKLATYVLGSRLTHICKKDNKYFFTSMDYGRIDRRVEDGVEPKSPIKIAVKVLTETEARSNLGPWMTTKTFQATGVQLFGKGASRTWTLAILSELKDKVHEIRRGTLEWVLRTALPLRDDFAVYLDGNRLAPSKVAKGRLKKWIIGKDLTVLPKPSPEGIELSENLDVPEKSDARFGLTHKDLGRITGYAEAYKDMLTGKSDEVGRSNGFFVYVRGRLINVVDGHFGIKPDELRHGTFGRIRVVVHMDGLDPHLQSDRERVREGPILSDAQNILRAIFNYVRPFVEKHDAEEEPGAKLARKLAGSPGSLARRPIVEMVRGIFAGKIRSRFVATPGNLSDTEKDRLLAELEQRLTVPEGFVAGVKFQYDSTSDDGIAIYNAVTAEILINGLHPFVGAFFDEFTGKTSGLPLEIFAMAEILLESNLYQASLDQEDIDNVMNARDQLLRYVAQESGKRTPITIANALRNARNNESQLEIELVAAFRSLGFDATRIGGNGKADGVAIAHLSPAADKSPRRYSVSLEAKSKKEDGKKLKTKWITDVARHRLEANCQHAVVVAPAFDHTPGNDSVLSKEIKRDRNDSAKLGEFRTITAIHVDDLARLVQLRPLKQLGRAKLRELFETCGLPEDCKVWVDQLEKTKFVKPPYARIVKAIEELQKEARNEPIQYLELRNELKHLAPPINYSDVDELIEICKAMAAMAPGALVANERNVELDQSSENVILAIESATSESQSLGS